jgi:hypothetical protein
VWVVETEGLELVTTTQSSNRSPWGEERKFSEQRQASQTLRFAQLRPLQRRRWMQKAPILAQELLKNLERLEP